MTLKNAVSAVLLITVLERQRQADKHEFEANLVYRASSKTATATQRNNNNKNAMLYGTSLDSLNRRMGTEELSRELEDRG